MNRRKRKIMAAGMLGMGALAAGALAFFADTEADSVSGKVGTLDLKVDTQILHTNGYAKAGDAASIAANTGDNANNINPGDNDFEEMPEDEENPDHPKKTRKGTDHEILVNVENLGNKSMITRTLIFVRGQEANPDAADRDLKKEELEYVKLFLNTTQNEIAPTISDDQAMTLDPTITTEQKWDASKKMGKLEPLSFNTGEFDSLASAIPADKLGGKALEESKTLVYRVNNNMVLSGADDGNAYETETVEDASEWETGTAYFNKTATETPATNSVPEKKSFVVELGLDRTVGETYSADGEAVVAGRLEGADLEFIVVVQAMQYRNTGDYSWETVFVGSHAASGPEATD